MAGARKARSFRAVLLAGLSLAVLTWSKTAAAEIEVPSYRGYVTDLAGALSGQDRQRITALIEALDQNTGAEIAVLVVYSTGDEPIFDYAMAAAEKWKPGKAGKDNGVVFLVATQDRSLYILVGYGLEGVLPDGKVGGIEDQYIIPSFKKGDYSRGIFAGVAAMASVIDPDHADAYGHGNFTRVKARPQAGRGRAPGPFQLIMGVIFFIVFIYLAIRHPGLLLLLLLSGRSSYGSGGGFGGGFGGFGGGGFGGGGAGRSW